MWGMPQSSRIIVTARASRCQRASSAGPRCAPVVKTKRKRMLRRLIQIRGSRPLPSSEARYNLSDLQGGADKWRQRGVRTNSGFSRSEKRVGPAQWTVAQAVPADVHDHRDRPLGRAFGAGVSGVRAEVAAPPGAWRAGTGVSVARALRGAPLRLRADHAGRHLDVAPRFRGPLANVVAGRARDPVLASHRARATPGAGHSRPRVVRRCRADEHLAAVVPASRAASVLQYGSLHTDGRGHVLPPLSERTRSCWNAMQLRPARAPSYRLTAS